MAIRGVPKFWIKRGEGEWEHGKKAPPVDAKKEIEKALAAMPPNYTRRYRLRKWWERNTKGQLMAIISLILTFIGLILAFISR